MNVKTQVGSKGPLHGIRVVDLGHFVAAPLAAMFLADQGADVVRVRRPDAPVDTPLDEVLDRGKRVVTLDLKSADGKAGALELLAQADIVLEGYRPGVMDRLGLGAAAARGANADLIYISMPGFPKSDLARANLQAWEGLLGAAIGLHTDVSLFRNMLGLPPAFTALPLASVYGAIHAANAAVAALLAREHSGLGDAIEVPLADAAMSAMAGILFEVEGQPRRYDTPLVPKVVRHGVLPVIRAAVKRSGAASQGRILNRAEALMPPLFRTFRCGDGRLLFINALDHARQSKALLESLGLLDELQAEGLVLGSPYESSGRTDNLNNISRLSAAWKKRIAERMESVLATRPALEWEAHFQAAGVPAGVHRTTSEWMGLAPLWTSGIIFENPSRRFVAVQQPGPIVSVGPPGEQLAGSQPSRADLNHVLTSWPPRTPTAKSAPRKGGFLSGTRVLDLSNVIAGPAASRTLAEYGADVIKVDAPDPQIGPRMSIWFGMDVGQGKRSLIVDLKTPEGQTILRQLVERADIVLHNYLDDAAERLGISEQQLRNIKPDIVSVQISAYGGPRLVGWEAYPAFDPVLQASSGIQTRFGNEGRPQLHAVASCIDYLTGYAASFGALTALFAERRGEGGAHVRTSLARSACFVQLPFAVSATERAAQDGPSGQDATGVSETHRMFRTSDGWIFVAPDPRSSQAIHNLYQAAGVGVAGDLPNAFRKRSTASWLKKLKAGKIAAHPVLSLADIRKQFRTNLGADTAFDTSKGPYRVLRHPHPSGYRVSLMAPTWVRPESKPVSRLWPAVAYGAHSRAIMEEVGRSPREIDQLVADEIIAERWRGVSEYLPK